MSRKENLGRFETKSELVEAVWAEYRNTNRKIKHIAVWCQVPSWKIHEILNAKPPPKNHESD